MKTILCPTDFSISADNAIHYAATMAAKMPATLLLIHALHVPLVDAYAPSSTLATMMEEVETTARKRIDNLTEEISGQYSIKVRPTIAFGLATDLVSKLEQSESVDLVVLGTHGVSNAIDVLLGTTASQIMAKAKCPTLVIPKDAKFLGLAKVGYATDFTDDSDDKIEAFVSIVKPFGSEITVVHVANSGEAPIEIDNILKNFEKVSKSVMVKGDDIPEELNTFIKKNNLGMLAMKRHKYNWFDKLFHKSITKQMVYHGEVPVLVFS